MPTTQSWSAAIGMKPRARLGKIGLSCKLSVVRTKRPERPHLECLFPHDPSYRFVIYVHALDPQLGGDAPVAIARKFRAQQLDPFLHRVSRPARAARAIIIGRPCELHESASLRDG